MFKKIIIGAAALGFATSAIAAVGPSISVDYDDVYVQTQHYETVEVTSCSKGDDKTTEGGVVGAVIGGSQGGTEGAILGGIIGAIIGDAAGEEKCTTTKEKRPTHVVSEHVGYDVYVTIDGTTYTIKHRH